MADLAYVEGRGRAQSAREKFEAVPQKVLATPLYISPLVVNCMD